MNERLRGLLRVALCVACIAGARVATPLPVYGYRVVATVGMIGDVAEEIVGDAAEVVTLIRSGIDPHLYAPTRRDVQELQNADVVLYVGALLEGRMSSVLDTLAEEKRHIHSLINSVSGRVNNAQFRAQFRNDPHIWMNVNLWKLAAVGIAEALWEYDPERRALYARNLQRYTAELDALHRYTVRVIGSIPAEQRVLITAHDAFAYFGRQYGMRVEGIQGISTESEAGVQRINELVDLIVERDIGAIFVESSVNDKNIRALISRARRRRHKVMIGGVLYSDAMGERGSYEGTYIGMLDHNATTIANALGGSTPPGGMQERLTE